MALLNDNTVLLEMKGIGKRFSGVDVLRDVRFDLKAGELHVLAGENGAGKSTLIKILCGVHTVYDGHLVIEGKSVRFNSVHDAGAHGISVIHQELSLVGAMTVAENIFLGREQCRLGWLSRKQMIQQAGGLLAEMGLNVDPTRPVEHYSIGVQQMIEICKALAYDCRILVMDEPTSALTRPEAEKLFTLIEQLKARGCGIIYISHKMEEIFGLADRITVLRDGGYIGTDVKENLTETKLVNWMIGRTLENQAPRKQCSLGKEMFRVEDFYVGNSAGSIDLVKGVSFSVRAGEIIGIAGLQGAGCSELLNGVFGSYGHRAWGKVSIDDEPLNRFNPAQSVKKGLALLTNDRKETGLVLGQSVLRNAVLASLKRFSPGGWIRPGIEKEAIQKRCSQLQLKARSLNQDVETLSGGNQQKVVMAKWIETHPKVFLLDEPTRGVDVGAKHEIYELLNQWTAAGMAIVMITSEMGELLAMSDRILVMRSGEIAAEFTRDEASQEAILSAAMSERTVVA